MRQVALGIGALVLLAGMGARGLGANDTPAIGFLPFGNQAGEASAEAGYATASAPGVAVAQPMPAYGPPATYPTGAVAPPYAMMARVPGAPLPLNAGPSGPAGLMGYSMPPAPGYGPEAPYPPAGSPYGPPGYYVGNGEPMGDGGCEDPTLSVKVGALFLYRSLPSARTLVTDFLSEDEVLNARGVPTGWGTGLRLDTIWNFHEEYDLEGVYFGIDNWHQARSVAGIGLVAPALSDNILFQDVAVRYGSDLYSGELNLRKQVTDRMHLLAGFRYIGFRDVASMDGISELGPATVQSKINNNLYGFQIGAAMSMLRGGGPWSLDSFIKGGIYGSKSSCSIDGSNVDGDFSSFDASTHAAFAGEVSFVPSYQFSEHFRAFAGYQFLWLQEVALAADQLGLASNVHSNKHVFYNGIQTGLEFTW